MSEEYLLTIIRHQDRQIRELTNAAELHGQALLSLAKTVERLKARIMLLEANEALEEMHEERRAH